MGGGAGGGDAPLLPAGPAVFAANAEKPCRGDPGHTTSPSTPSLSQGAFLASKLPGSKVPRNSPCFPSLSLQTLLPSGFLRLLCCPPPHPASPRPPPPRPPRTQRNPAAPRVTTAGVFLTVQLQCLREPGCTNPGRGGTLNSSCASASSRLGSSSPRVTLSSSGTWVCVCPGAAALPPPLEASRLVALLLGSSGGRWPERIPSPLRVPSYH